jgi:hypothetical protein
MQLIIKCLYFLLFALNYFELYFLFEIRPLDFKCLRVNGFDENSITPLRRGEKKNEEKLSIE